MAVTHLECKECKAQYPLEALFVCEQCFGPLEAAYEHRGEGQDVAELRRRIQGGPQNIWRYADFLPLAGGRPGPSGRLASRVGLPAGCTPLIRADRLAEQLGLREVWVKNDAATPTHSFKDRVVAVAAAKARELGFGTLACSSTGNLANAVAARAAAEGLEAVVICPVDLEPEKLLATAVYGATIYAVRGSYDHCSRLTVELSFELPWAFVNVGLRSYYAEGSKTVAYEIAEQLGWRAPSAVVGPIASGSLFTKVWQGFKEFQELGLLDGPLPRLSGGQGEGCAPGATAFDTGERVAPIRPDTTARSLAIGSPADGDLAVATARAAGGAIYAPTGIFGEPAPGVALGALRTAVARGELGAGDEVVLLVTGDGLKTPGVVAGLLHPIEIEADADALLDSLGVHAV